MFNWYNVYKEFYEFNPHPKQAAIAAYHQLRYGNNWERVVFGKQTNVRKAEKVRYEWAAKHVSEYDLFIDLGCGTGYGSRFITNRDYIGIDLDPVIIKFAEEQYGTNNIQFRNMAISQFLNGYKSILKNSVIVAFEIIEHIKEGKELAQQLKVSGAKKVLLSVPYNEKSGRWGKHHMLHRLTVADFPGFEAFYMDMKTGLVFPEPPSSFSEDRDFLLLLKYETSNE